jgi:glutamine amidotransferase
MISIIDYKAGNLTSVKRALDFLGIPCAITHDARIIRESERIIFPGVGNAASAVPVLRERRIDKALREAFELGTPILGICLGTQIILSRSEEGDTDDIVIRQPHFLLKDVAPGTQMYFVHSYYPLPDDESMVIASCSYEIEFPCAIGRGNLFATQFHPEKSGPAGLSILKNFAAWDPKG